MLCVVSLSGHHPGRFAQLTPLLLHIIKNTGCKNYTKELVLLIYQLNYILSDRMKNEVLFMRTVNNHARQGKNIACNLTMEHHNNPRRVNDILPATCFLMFVIRCHSLAAELRVHWQKNCSCLLIVLPSSSRPAHPVSCT